MLISSRISNQKKHNSVLSGHLDKKKTKEKLSQRFFWFEMREDINIWIQQCEICCAIKPPGMLSWLKGFY
jgi:hypothetical protein